MKTKFNIYILSFCAILFTQLINAQGPPPPGLPPPVGLPIDGGLSFLIISGVAYGLYEIRKKR